MTSLPCTTAQDITALKQYISTYAQHPNQLLYAGRSYVSTFAGERCTFGQGGNLNSAWTAAVKSGPPVYFVPSFFVDPGSFSTLTVMDGAFNVSDSTSSFFRNELTREFAVECGVANGEL
jgi:glucan endo-1,3-alpha-glucosidase